MTVDIISSEPQVHARFTTVPFSPSLDKYIEDIFVFQS